MSTSSGGDAGVLVDVVHALRSSVSEAAGLVHKFKEGADSGDVAFPDGISLLTVKVDALLAYIHQVALLCASRLNGRSLSEQPGRTYVERLVTLRLLLEKLRPMETRLKYQVEKLLRAVADAERDSAQPEEDDEVDPLAFRPNPEGFAAETPTAAAQRADEDKETEDASDQVYRPPKVAPVLYDPDAHVSRKARQREREPSRNAALLADLSAGMSSNPYETSAAGVGGGAALGNAGSSRARALRRMQEYEEENFKRLSLSKKDAKRRRRDEQDVALGGLGLSARNGSIRGGIEEEFGDLLRGSERDARRRERGEDAYTALQKRARLPTTAARAQKHAAGASLDDTPTSTRKFKKAMRSHKRRARDTA